MKGIARKTALSVGLLAVSVFALCGSLVPAAWAGPDLQREVNMGREAAAEIEKENKLVTDLQVVDRVNRMGQELAQIANSVSTQAAYGSPEICPFDYKFKVIESEDINAFSLPGGLVYVNTGLLKYVQSDHELAGVLAHEIAHAAHHHMVYLVKEQSKMDGQIALLLLAGMLSKVDASDLGNLLVGAQLVKIARVSGYGQKAESDADRTAVEYLATSKYNPVGCVTFLERLARDYARKPQVNLGIMQTHPPSRQRVKNAIEQIESLGLPINRRAVTNPLKAVAETATVNGKTITRVKLAESVLFEPAPIEGVITSEARAEAIATKVNQVLDAEPQLRDIRLGADNRTVIAKGEQIIAVTDEDSALLNKPADELARQAADVLRRVIWQDLVASIY